MQGSVASDLVLYCLPMSYKKYTRIKWVKPEFWQKSFDNVDIQIPENVKLCQPIMLLLL